MGLHQNLKRQIKRGLQHVVARYGTHTRTPRSPQLLILMYHRVLPPDDERVAFEEPGMTVSPATFKMNLEILAKYFEFVQLSDWLHRKSQGMPLPNKACAITFDDGWADNYEYAYPILQETGVPATIFVVTALLGTNRMFWPERLARIMVNIAAEHPQAWASPYLDWLRQANTDFTLLDIIPTREQISRYVAYAKQWTDQENHRRLDQIERELNLDLCPKHTSLLDWDQLGKMITSGLIEAGSHTCNHTRLTEKTPIEDVRREILDSKQQIEASTKQPVKTFCFPNGDYTQAALELVQHNYSGAVMTESGWNTVSTDNYQLRRIGVHEDIARDKTAFLARISGWM